MPASRDPVERPEGLSDGLWRGLLTKVSRMEQQELAYYRYIQPLYEQLFPSYLQQLRAEYYALFSPLIPAPGQAPTFDLRVAAQTNLASRWVSDMDAMLTAIEDEWQTETETQMEEAHDDGWFLALWLVNLQNATVFDEDAASDLTPPDGSALPYLAAAAIAGLGLAQRATAWRSQALDKARQQIGAAAATGASWAEVEQTVQRILTQYRHGLSALGADEIYRARVHGEGHAIQSVLAGGYVQHLWLTRMDELVCPICAPLHGALTDLQPVDDTHPRCRCITIPMLDIAGGAGAVVSYDTFTRSLRGSPPVAAF